MTIELTQSETHFIEVFSDTDTYPTIGDVARALGLRPQTVKNKAAIIRNKGVDLVSRIGAGTPLSEIEGKYQDGWTKDDCLNELLRVQSLEPERELSRNFFRINSKISDATWTKHFGTFLEFKRQAGIQLTRHQHKVERAIAGHASVDHYRSLSAVKEQLGDVYLRNTDSKWKTVLACSDLHDIDCDPFYLRVLIDTAKRVQPDVICFTGDVFDLPEFSRYTVDPREWDAVGRIKFVHEHIFAPVREACPDAQIDLIAGNHSHRLFQHLADATPALRSLLSDLHGMTLQKLLGLDAYQINLVSKDDLAARNQTDIKKEVAKNYRIYWNCLLAHHFPHAKKMGLPGWNGHHHQHKVESLYSPVFGSYEWHQLGAGHVRRASYCEGEKWSNGFALVNCNSESRSTQFDYVTVGDEFSVSAGKWYYREPDEILFSHAA